MVSSGENSLMETVEEVTKWLCLESVIYYMIYPLQILLTLIQGLTEIVHTMKTKMRTSDCVKKQAQTKVLEIKYVIK